MKFTMPLFSRDSRGNRVLKHAVTKRPDGTTRWLYILGPEEAAAQIEMAYPSFCHQREFGEPTSKHYNYCFEFPNGKPNDLGEFVEVLEQVLTLPATAHIDCAIALDWYKVPDDSVDSMHWANTESGELNYRGKYFGAGPQTRTARRELVRVHSDLISRHPLYRDASTIVTVPGHKSDGSGFGEWLAAQVAQATGKSLVPTECPSGPRPEAKESGSTDGVTFRMPTVLAGDVIVLDDVWRTGASMSGVACAARLAGAQRMFGLVTVRTMRH